VTGHMSTKGSKTSPAAGVVERTPVQVVERYQCGEIIVKNFRSLSTAFDTTRQCRNRARLIARIK
jgi:hypothetical protein